MKCRKNEVAEICRDFSGWLTVSACRWFHLPSTINNPNCPLTFLMNHCPEWCGLLPALLALLVSVYSIQWILIIIIIHHSFINSEAMDLLWLILWIAIADLLNLGFAVKLYGLEPSDQQFPVPVCVVVVVSVIIIIIIGYWLCRLWWWWFFYSSSGMEGPDPYLGGATSRSAAMAVWRLHYQIWA